ncbi:MAG: hypothetical protein J4G10_06635 [Alphaproteobacteria bacterium]|nr:hypothetical protein [Alphaproteobacteria bacterium]
MAFSVQSAFDVALWFLDQASAEDSYLPPQKLHRLLFLAQAYYAVEREGAKLMPAVFVADLQGPTEPNVARAFEHGRPNVVADQLSADTDEFLYGIWRRYGHLNVEHLNQLVATVSGFDQMLAAGQGEEVPMRTICQTLKGKKTKRLGRTHNGKPIQRWIPGVKSAN